jgi:cell division protein FtsI (penicillin-binding protein 3)
MAARRDKRAKRAKREEQALPSYTGRRHTVLALFGIAAAVLVWRAVDQQILEKDFLQSEGADRYLARVEVAAHRGLITDRRGDVLALSTPVDSVAANPRLLQPDSAQLASLAKALSISTDNLSDRLARYRHKHFVYLRRRLPPAHAAHVMDVVRAHGIRGVHLEREYRRYYPAGEVFGHVVGFTNVDDAGQEGIELAYDAALRGKPGAKRVLRDGRRQAVDDVENIRSPRAGDHIALSIDQRLQFIAYRELKAAVQRHRALAGSLVMLDTRTGEVLAMVNQPSFNPNGDRASRAGRLRNRAATDVYEPGSTMKPFAVAAALDQGTIAVDTRIDTGPGHFYVGAARVRDSKNLGVIDIETLLRRSSNVAASKIALGMESRDLWRAMNRLGFGRAPGSGFPGEASGRLSDFNRWAKIDQATLAFGYGLSVTTLQLAQAYAAIGNDGVLMPASLVKQADPQRGRRVFKAETARTVRRMLESVTGDEGTAPQAAVAGYRVAGKTGTVKKLGPDGYSDDRYLALFAGVAPASMPRVALVVMVDEPRAGAYYGGEVAGPVFANVMAESLRLLNVAPDARVDNALRVAQAARRPADVDGAVQ